MIASFVVIILAKNYSDSTENKYSASICPKIEITQDMAFNSLHLTN